MTVRRAPRGTFVAIAAMLAVGVGCSSSDDGAADDGRVAVDGTAHDGRDRDVDGRRPPSATRVPDVSIDARATIESTAPTEPPAPVCGDEALLAGPADPPDGAVVIDVGDDPVEVTASAPPGTTFWFAPGVHRFAAEFDNITPDDGDTYIGGPGAVLDGGEVAKYAFVGAASKVTIRYLTVQRFDAPNNEGVVNHDSGDGWIVEYTTIHDNAGAALMMGSRNVYRSNCLADNGQYGINAFRCRSWDDAPSSCGGPIVDIVVEGNEISGNNQDDWETLQPGCGCTGGVKFWDVDGAVVVDNWFDRNLSVGLWADNNNRNFLVEGNFFSENSSEAMFFEAGYDAIVRNNTLVRNTWDKGRRFADRGDSFPVGTIYLSEAGSDRRLDLVNPQFEIVGNVFIDNWGGVVLWENSDRFCSSPAHTHGSYCTLHFGDGYDPEPCSQGRIESVDDVFLCRWPTENVLVAGNHFELDKDAVGCAGTWQCGLSAIVANYGSYPDWSPFPATVIQERITYEQNNRFEDNVYIGEWGFNPLEPGNLVTWDEWRQAPFGQDSGSSWQP
jgi:hypothetical protein